MDGLKNAKLGNPSTVPSTCTSRASARPSRTTPRSRAASSRCAAATPSPRLRTEPMRRLYLKIYGTIIVSLVLVVIVAGGVWRWGSAARRARRCSRSRAKSQASRCLPRPRRRPNSNVSWPIWRSASAATSRLHRRRHADRGLRPAAAAAAGQHRRRMAVWPGRPGLGVPPARRPAPGGAGAAAASQSVGGLPAGAGRDRSCGCDSRLSLRARADATAGAASGWRREARRGQSLGPCRCRGQGRGGAARRNLQPLRRAHRRPDEVASDAARQRVA